MRTTMCHPFPPEILDLFVDQLHDEPTALRACCLVSKSWVPRSRTHLFACVKFTQKFPLDLWAETFPDPSDSPAYYTRTLTIQGPLALTSAGANAGRWVRAFHNVVHLRVSNHPLIPFHGLSPTIKSLQLQFDYASPSEAFGLICSFPLLEDLELRVYGYGNQVDEWTTPSASPRLAGSLRTVGIGVQSAPEYIPFMT